MRALSLINLMSLLPVVLSGCERGTADVPPPAAEAKAIAPGELLVSAQIPEPTDGCLAQAVKDLGLSAKRDGQQLRWTVKGKMLHSALSDAGGMTLTVTRAAPLSTFSAVVNWERPVPEQAGAELTVRLREIARKVGLFCGQLQTEVACVRRVAGVETGC